MRAGHLFHFHHICIFENPFRLLSRLWNVDHQPLLRLSVSKVNQRGARILRQIRQAGFDDGTRLINYAPGNSLGFFIGHSFQWLHLARERIFKRT